MTKAAAIDLSSLDTSVACARGFELELQHPITKAPLGSFITIVGKDSPAFEGFVKRQANDTLRRRFQLERKGRDAEAPTVEEIEARSIDLLVAATTGFRNITFEGADLSFNEDNARKLYTTLKWVRGQVDEAIGDLENFMTA